MATMQNATAGVYRTPAKKTYTFIQAALYYTLCAGWEAAEFLRDLKIVAEVKLRAVVYRLPLLVRGAAIALRELRVAKLAACLVLTLVLLLTPADALFNIARGDTVKKYDSIMGTQETAEQWYGINSLMTEIEDREFAALAALPMTVVPVGAGAGPHTGIDPDANAGTGPDAGPDLAESMGTGAVAAVNNILTLDTGNDESALTQTAKGRRFIKTYIEIDSETGEGIESVLITGHLTGPFTRSYIWPTSGPVTSGFGRRKIPIGSRNHQGIDIGGNSGQPIYASGDGVVVYSGWNDSYGNMIRIRHDNGDETVYGHCKSLSVKKGKYVKQGTKIAAMGSTGTSIGVHLHFELSIDGKNVDPMAYLPEP